ncbi:TPA_asm: hypothetical protein [Sphaeridiorhabdovirus 1]|nr:TPA_asm: hypothetical protein [Sphaeridiorhabdovirus 1]
MESFASKYIKRKSSSFTSGKRSPMKELSPSAFAAGYTETPGIFRARPSSSQESYHSIPEVLLPKGYQIIEGAASSCPPALSDNEEYGRYHRAAYTFMVKLRVTPSTNQPFNKVFPDIVSLIDSASNHPREWKRLACCIMYLSQPVFTPVIHQGIPAQDCFRTGKYQIDMYTKNPAISFIIAVERTVRLCAQYRSVALNLSLFSNQEPEGIAITGSLIQESTKTLGKVVKYTAVSSPSGACVSFM